MTPPYFKWSTKTAWRGLNERLYTRRREGMPQEGNRTRLTAGLSFALLVGIAWFFFAATTARLTPQDYLQKRARVVIPTDDDMPWTWRAQSDSHWHDLDRWEDLNTAPNGPIQLRLSLPRSVLAGLNDYLTVALVVPGLRYNKAEVTLESVHHRAFFLNRKIVAILEPKSRLDLDTLSIDIYLTPTPDHTSWYERQPEPTYLATQAEMEEFEAYRAAELAGKGSSMAVITRMVLALFVLLFFLIIDSSPESLGLALAMGFDAISMMLTNRWFPVSLLGSRFDLALAEALQQLSMMWQLFFVAQMARLAPKQWRPWAAAGLAQAVFFGALRYYKSTSITNHDWPIWTAWPCLLSIAGMAIAVAGLASVRGKNLPWRTTALGVALAAVTIRAISFGLLWLEHDQTDTLWRVVVDVLQPNVPFLFVISTFLNISTMEARIKAQSLAIASSRELEHELEIGRKVQASLHRIPELPKYLPFTVYYEAIAYVSGDTFYTHYNASRQRFVLMLLDVTGHGIQAALKASACQAIAANVFTSDSRTDASSNLVHYQHQVSHYLDQTDQQADIAAFVGYELNTHTGQLHVMRNNYLSPFVIEPVYADRDGARSVSGQRLAYSSDGGVQNGKPQFLSWKVKPLSLANSEVQVFTLQPGSFLVLMSDGLIDSSVTMTHLVRSLRSDLQRETAELNIFRLKSLILESGPIANAAIEDDKTCLILQWQGPASAAKKNRSVA